MNLFHLTTPAPSSIEFACRLASVLPTTLKHLIVCSGDISLLRLAVRPLGEYLQALDRLVIDYNLKLQQKSGLVTAGLVTFSSVKCLVLNTTLNLPVYKEMLPAMQEWKRVMPKLDRIKLTRGLLDWGSIPRDRYTVFRLKGKSGNIGIKIQYHSPSTYAHDLYCGSTINVIDLQELKQDKTWNTDHDNNSI
ncbi:hypothetical protein BDN72DRAFT_863715 [Pluteus cervinus]|uniref:Uncharacterized protein n=1 Tax=Pluteus cervinus TaxID=181527 RepID=A0ACD3A7B4_9AGAR|nr:hypothetical protein BDN72DRAFT_863715 [Pluteus cervinus]